MTRSELRVLSDAFAVALAAMSATENRSVPMAAAFALRESAAVDLPGFVPDCARFAEALRRSRGQLRDVEEAGRVLRDAVSRAMAFRPVDAQRVDIHG